MKVHKFNEKDLDERLALDKRRDRRAFRICFDSLDEAPKSFYDFQFKTGDGLRRVFLQHFDGSDENLLANPWDSNKYFFNTDMFGSETLTFELNHEILDDKLLGLIMSYIEQKCPQFCFLAAVYENFDSNKYLGRFVVNLEEIAVEETLVETWSKQVQFMPIEN